eukprot:gene5018-7005_t
MNFTKDNDTSLITPANRKVMRDGDLVIVYERHDSLSHTTLKGGMILDNKFGSFHHDDMIGKFFGTRISSRTSNGWIYLLEPSPELWSNALNTRTQIVNELDSSFVIFNLDIHPGSIVVESGTGSGCLTLALARAVFPSGHVYTFEYNGIRAEQAKQEFIDFGVSGVVTITCKDVCGKFEEAYKINNNISGNEDDETNGQVGGFVGVSPSCVDAVFLDLPEPWLAIDHAMHVLKAGGKLCCYSPCLEQVMKTCEKMRDVGLHSIRMVEIRQRPYDGRVTELETLDLGLNEEEDRINSLSHRDGLADSNNNIISVCSNNKRPRDENLVSNEDYHVKLSKQDDFSSSQEKEVISDSNNNNDNYNVNDNNNDSNKEYDRQAAYVKRLANRIKNRPKSCVNGVYKMNVARPIPSMKGHTAFLTFAIKK